jgi:hypothetical protein
MKHLVVISLILLVGLTSCWPTSVSFNDKGSLNPCLKYFEIDQLEISAANAPINYSIELTEALKAGLQNNTRLLIASNTNKPQVTINGKITNYTVSPIALQQGDNASQNRLSVSVAMNIYFECASENYTHEMKMVSTRFADFNANTDISSVESQLLSEINAQILQDLINQILSNW